MRACADLSICSFIHQRIFLRAFTLKRPHIMDEDLEMEYIEEYLLELLREVDDAWLQKVQDPGEQVATEVSMTHDESISDHPTDDEAVMDCSEDVGDVTDNEIEDSDHEEPGDNNDDHDGDNESRSSSSNSTRSDGSHATTKSWFSDEPPPLVLNYDAIKHMATQFIPGSHGACVDITTIPRGTFHEVRLLHFEDGWTCIARFTREEERLLKTESELATIEYVREHTSIPVPKTFLVNYNENHVVGSPFVFMERIEGGRLSDIWGCLSTSHKLSIVEQTANIVGQLADLHFDKIGSLTSEGAVGPLLNISREAFDDLEGPFTTTLDYVRASLNENRLHRPKEAMDLYPEIKEEIAQWLKGNPDPNMKPPFRLIHNDLNTWNIMVVHPDPELPPRITGVIDWDWAYTGPSYYLFEYPATLIECKNHEDDEAQLKLLRKHFVKTLVNRYPKGSQERANVKRCFREKREHLNDFTRLFCSWGFNQEGVEHGVTEGYLTSFRRELEEGYWNHPYGGCDEYVPDSDPESDDER